MPQPIVWKKPKGEFSAKMSGLVMPGPMIVHAGARLDVRVWTFCGKEACDMTVVVRETATVMQVCRQAEIAASIQHVARRLCDGCRQKFFHELTTDEKKWLYADDPKLGPVIGVGGAEGIT